MTLPTIHINGTDVEDLIEANTKAHQALQSALEAMHGAAPHGRDYYLQEAMAINKAIDDHCFRCHSISEVIQQYADMHEYLTAAREKRHLKT